MDIKISRSSRHTLSLVVTREGIEARAPQKMALAKIQHFLDQKQSWIEEKQQELTHLNEIFPPLNYASGDQIWFLGTRYSLQIKPGNFSAQRIHFDHGYAELQLKIRNPDPASVKRALIRFYREEATPYITHRIRHYALDIDRPYTRIKIKTLSGRWGSCSTSGLLVFNWALMMASPMVIDYVVVHELCHLKEMNHSPKFWGLVKSILPEYNLAKSWLRENGLGLSLNKVPGP